MKYTLTARIEPSGPFGVPEEGMTILPSTTGEIFGPVVDTRLGQVVGHGALSIYRPDENRLQAELVTPGGSIRLNDNYVFAVVEAGPADAFGATADLLSRFLHHLSLTQKRLYTSELLGLTDGDGRRLPLPQAIDLIRVTTYDLAGLKRDIEDSAGCVALDDHQLNLAIDYYELALLLFGNRRLLADALSRQHSMLISTAFLNLWKAISTVIGDPSVDRDYQSRYKTLGFDVAFFKDRIEWARELRNHYDVAHYSLDPTHLDAVEKAFGEAANIAAEVLQRYRTHLLAGTP